MTVAADGSVTVPQVGEVEVAGLDLATATTVLKQKIRLFVPTLDSLTLKLIAQSGSPRVYVIGQVVRPGAQTFNTIPSLWELVRAAGGPTPGANLRAARIIREVEGLPEVIPVDLAGILDGVEVPDVQLRNGDTLIIPQLAEGVSGVPSEDGVKVFGAVGVPTVVPMREPLRLLDVIMLAGAPTEQAKLEQVHWVHHEGGRIQSAVVVGGRDLLRGDHQLGPGQRPLDPRIPGGPGHHPAGDRPALLRRLTPAARGVRRPALRGGSPRLRPR
jgi:protein involved in polysaccharide export with SLBB domain